MDSNYKKVGYDTTILLIEKKAVNNVSWDELFGIKEFINLYEHSPFYIDNAIGLLGPVPGGYSEINRPTVAICFARSRCSLG